MNRFGDDRARVLSLSVQALAVQVDTHVSTSNTPLESSAIVQWERKTSVAPMQGIASRRYNILATLTEQLASLKPSRASAVASVSLLSRLKALRFVPPRPA